MSQPAQQWYEARTRPQWGHYSPPSIISLYFSRAADEIPAADPAEIEPNRLFFILNLKKIKLLVEKLLEKIQSRMVQGVF